MDKFAETKVEYYGKPIEYLKKYRTIFLPIVFAIMVLRLLTSITNPSLSTVVSVILGFMYVISFFMFTMLDKSAFWVNIITAVLSILWFFYSCISVVVSSMLPVSAAAGFGAITAMIAGASVVVIIIEVIFDGALITFFVLAIVRFVKHKRLFFTPYKELKKQAVE